MSDDNESDPWAPAELLRAREGLRKFGTNSRLSKFVTDLDTIRSMVASAMGALMDEAELVRDGATPRFGVGVETVPDTEVPLWVAVNSHWGNLSNRSLHPRTKPCGRADAVELAQDLQRLRISLSARAGDTPFVEFLSAAEFLIGEAFDAVTNAIPNLPPGRTPDDDEDEDGD
jgi:hypothetical protein